MVWTKLPSLFAYSVTAFRFCVFGAELLLCFVYWAQRRPYVCCIRAQREATGPWSQHLGHKEKQHDCSHSTSSTRTSNGTTAAAHLAQGEATGPQHPARQRGRSHITSGTKRRNGTAAKTRLGKAPVGLGLATVYDITSRSLRLV